MLACGFCTFLCTVSTTPCLCRHNGQGGVPRQLWLWLGERQIPQGATCPLGSTEHFYSLWEIGRNQQNRALKVKQMAIRSGSCLLCTVFRGCKHRSIKDKTTMVLCEPLSAYTTFSFSALARIARKILK